MEHIEASAEQIQEDGDKVADGASRKLMREAIGDAGYDNFESALDSIESFLSNIELFDPDVAFEQASIMLQRASLAFGDLDDNHDMQLSRNELAHHLEIAEGELKETLEWVQQHFEAIAKMELADHTNGISKKDLGSASDFFAGLNFVHLNFENVAGRHRSKEQTLTHNDLDSWLSGRGKGADAQVRHGVTRLSSHLQQMESSRGMKGLTDAELMKLELPDEA